MERLVKVRANIARCEKQQSDSAQRMAELKVVKYYVLFCFVLFWFVLLCYGLFDSICLYILFICFVHLSGSFICLFISFVLLVR